MGNAEGAARNEHFRTIAEHDMTFFQKNDRSDLEATIKYWIGLLPRMSKQEISLRERCLGFNLDPHSVWNYPPAVLDTFNIDTIMNDAMHCYFATGICNSEIILLLQAAKDHMGATVQDLCEACLVARWKRHDVKESQAWLKRLWKPAFFGSDMYKGSGSQTEALMHLLRWIAESVWMAIPAMQPYCLCFRALCKCVDALNVFDDTKTRLGTTESCASRASETLCSLVPGECETKASSPPAFTRAICKTRLSSDVLGRRKQSS